MNTDIVEVFVGDTSGPEEYVAFFEATRGNPDEETPPGGYLYISDTKEERIVRHLEIYKDPTPRIEEEDVQIFWSSNRTKCGVAIWGRMRGIMNLADGNEICIVLQNPDSEAITDSKWLEGFENYLDQNQFIRARQRFWKEVAKQYRPAATPIPVDETPIETNFIRYAKGMQHWFAVFEDDGAAGYLYLYDSREQKIVEHVHDYDRSEKLTVSRKDVEVVWSEDGNKCAVIIWSKMRGIIDLKKTQPGRVWMVDRDTPGIDDPEWLRGFEYLYA